MSSILISNLTFGYDGSPDLIFDRVSFQMDTDWKLGFIGRNGRGKTTFLKLLAGRLPCGGAISSSACFDLFPFDVPNPEKATLDVLCGIAPEAEQWRLERELSLLEIREDVLNRPFSTLSSGEQTKALLAALFLRDNHFLLIDEPTNHLDAQARETLGRYLKSKRGFILVSHDRALLDGCVDHVLSINRAGIEVQRGNFSSWQSNRQRQEEYERAQHSRLQKEVKKLSEAARRTSSWSDSVEKEKYHSENSGLRVDRGYIGHKSAKMMKRAKALETRREKALQEKSSLLKNEEEAGALSLCTLSYKKETLLRAESLSVSYGESPIMESVSFTLRRGERIALTGRNGTGKSSLIKLLLGNGVPHHGVLSVGSGLTVSHVPQDASFLRGGLMEYADSEKLNIPLFLAILRKLGFPRDQFSHDLSAFSEGQKKKVLLAQSLCRPAHLYVWDEPLNYIDVISRMQVEGLILSCRPTMLFVEHDRAFVQRVATGEILLKHPG